MLEIKNTITEMANAFDESINNWTRLKKKNLWAWGYDNRNFWQLKSRENKDKKREREREYIRSMWKWKSLSYVQHFAIPWTIQTMEFSRAEYWSE